MYLPASARCLRGRRKGGNMKDLVRRLVPGLLLAGLLVFGTALAQPPRPDPATAFRLGDTNGDGQLSREEFIRLLGNAPRFRATPEQAAQLFERLDVNKDGFLSLEEFRKLPE